MQIGAMMYRRENIDRKIVDIERLLATTDDQLVIALLNMAIESYVAERDSLLPQVNPPMAKGADTDNAGVAATSETG